VEKLYHETVANAIESIQYNGFSNLFIFSNGGHSVVAELGVQQLMPRRITTIGGHSVGSAALDIFLCGINRLAFSDSMFFFHEASYESDGRLIREFEAELAVEIEKLTYRYQQSGHLLRRLDLLRRANELTGRILARQTKLSYGRVRELMRGDGCQMDAREALFYGLVHEIIPCSYVDFDYDSI
jgi:ATP-dependent protease ClpP protease subunit